MTRSSTHVPTWAHFPTWRKAILNTTTPHNQPSVAKLFVGKLFVPTPFAAELFVPTLSVGELFATKTKDTG